MRRVILFLTTLALFSCRSKTESEAADVSVVDSIYVQFEKTDYADFRIGLYVLGEFQDQTILDDRYQLTQALPFDSTSFLHSLDLPHDLFIPIQPGDSVIVRFHDYLPEVRVLNNTRFSAYELNFSTQLSRRNESILEYLFKKAQGYITEPPAVIYQRSLAAIDSNLHAGLISETYADLFRDQCHFAYHTLGLTPKFINEELDHAATINQDEQLSSRFYRSFARAYLTSKLPAKYNMEDIVRGANDYLSGETREMTVFKFLKEKFGQTNNQDSIKAALEIAGPIFSNRQYYDYLQRKYAYTVEVPSSMKDPIVNTLEESTELDVLLAKHRGKPVYIDFWASWCAPCRAEMPASRTLQSRFGEEVAFLYLSIDKSFPTWLGAHQQEKLGDEQSYWIPDFMNADVIKRHKISSIPRYFLIDAAGKTVDDNAPRPGDEALAAILEKMLTP